MEALTPRPRLLPKVSNTYLHDVFLERGGACQGVHCCPWWCNSVFMLRSWDLPRAERIDHALSCMVYTAPLERKITCRIIWGKFPCESQ